MVAPNVLMTSVGRRGLLLAYFRAALEGRGRLIAADMSAAAPALSEADEWVVVPPVQDGGYVEALLELCERKSVGLVVSLNDLELPILAAAAGRFSERGARVLVPSCSVVELCFDKWMFYRRMLEWELPVPKTYLRLDDVARSLRAGLISFPLIVKPRWGTASIGVEKVFDWKELEHAYSLSRSRLARSIVASCGDGGPDERIIIQEVIHGGEFGLDIVNDLEGKNRAVLVRRKLAMRAGETDRAVTESVPVLEELGARLGTLMGHPGVMDCDAFLSASGPVLLESNARFGGGYPFSQIAGADVPGAIIDWLHFGTTRRPLRIAPGIVASKVDNIIVREL